MLKRFLLSRFSLVIVVVIGGFLAINLLLEIFFRIQPPLGNHHDFLAFYSAAYFVLHGKVDSLFNPTSISDFQLTILPYKVGAAGYMPFLNPPFVAVLLTPLAFFSPFLGRILWLALNFSLYLSTLLWLTKFLHGKLKILAIVFLLLTFPIYQALIEAQLSVILLASCALALYFAQKQHYYTCGIFLSALLIKPQFAFFVITGLLIFRLWKIIFGMVFAGIILFLATLPFTGLGPYITYGRFSLGVLGSHFSGAGSLNQSVWQGDLSLTAGINGLFVSIFGQSSTSLVNAFTAVTALFLIILYWLAILKVKPGFGNPSGELMLIVSIILVLLLDPHLYSQDVILLYLTLPMLLNRFKNSLLVVVGLVLFSDLLLIKPAFLMHSFTLILICFSLYICLTTIKSKQLNQKVSQSFTG